MSKEGFDSNRSRSGTDISKLAKITGCSYQMSRKYVLGLALPELYIVVKIASWLKTSPSWLLFGESETLSSTKTGAMIEIAPDLLKYILKKSSILFQLSKNTDEIINFIVEAAYDASHLKTDPKTIHKIIDMMISSATLMSQERMSNPREATINN